MATRTWGDEGEGMTCVVPLVAAWRNCGQREEAKRFTKDDSGVHCARSKKLAGQTYRFALSLRALGTIHAIGDIHIMETLQRKEAKKTLFETACNTLQRINIKV